MDKLCIELNVSEASSLYSVLKNSNPDTIIDKHIVEDIMKKIKEYMED